MDNYPLISVIVPVYNVDKYLERCVDSLLKQSYRNIEIILVDDGSTDTSPVICDRFSREYDNVIVYHKINEGLGLARNYGVYNSKGDWIVFVDSDDYVEEDYIMYMWNLSYDGSVDLVSCEIAMESEDGAILSISSNKELFVCSPKEAFFNIYIKGIGRFTAYSKLIKKEIAQTNPFPEGYYEDFATTYKYIRQSSKISFGDGGLHYRYIQRQGSILNRKLEKNHFHCFEICEELALYIRNTYPEYGKYIVLLYESQMIQILNRQSMGKEAFERLFMKYRPLFRKSIPPLLLDKNVSKSQRAIGVLLCTSPQIYKTVRELKKVFKNMV